MATVKKGAVENLQDKGDVLQVKDRTGEAHTQEETLQGSEEEREAGGLQICLPTVYS